MALLKHWHTFAAPGLPVTFPALATKHFRWRGLYGVQIGPWFIGAIKGQVDPSPALQSDGA